VIVGSTAKPGTAVINIQRLPLLCRSLLPVIFSARVRLKKVPKDE